MNGVLTIEGQTQTLTPAGWEGPFAETLNTMFPLGSTEVGDPVCRAFYLAEIGLGERATIVSRPEPAPWPGNN